MPYTLTQHSGVGRSSVGRWTVVHSRGDSQRVTANMTENCLPPPDAEAGFLPLGLREPGHQGRYSELTMTFFFNNSVK